MVVLVNRYSASASEIVSACLQDHKRAVVIGERTWGKGSVQNVIELEGGKSALKLTTASYHRPNGKNIHRFPDAKESDEWGVMPDDGFEVKLNGCQTGRLIEHRRQRDILVGKHAKAAAAAKAQAAGDAKPTPEPDRKPAKPGAAQPEPAKPEPTSPTPRPAEPKPDEPAKPTDAEKPTKDRPKSGRPKPPRRAAKDSEAPFVDVQLQKAVDYLTQELARAQMRTVLTARCRNRRADVAGARLSQLARTVSRHRSGHEEAPDPRNHLRRNGGGRRHRRARSARLGRGLAGRPAPALRRRGAGDRLAGPRRADPAGDRRGAARGPDLTLADLDAVAVANTPGLAGSLLVGLAAAKALCAGARTSR